MMTMTHRDALLCSYDGPVPAAEMRAAEAKDAAGAPLCHPVQLDRLDDADLLWLRRGEAGQARQAKAMARQLLADRRLARRRLARCANDRYARDWLESAARDATDMLRFASAHGANVAMIDAELQKRGHLPRARGL